jgi:hypothetical protein
MALLVPIAGRSKPRMALRQRSTSAASTILRDEVEQSRFAIGGQMAVYVDGRLVESVAAGMSEPYLPMTDSCIYNVWCGTKAIFHTAALHLLWSLDLGDYPLADLVSPDVSQCLPDMIGAMNAAELVSHHIGISDPHVMEIMHTMPSNRTAFVLERIAKARPEGSAGTYAPSKLLELALAHTLGADVGLLIQDWCRAHLQHSDEVRFSIDPNDLSKMAYVIKPYVLTRYSEAVYSYHDRIPSVACHDRLAAGGYTSMRALAEFYSLLINGSKLEPDFLGWLTGCDPITVRDDSIAQDMTFIAGFHTRPVGFQPPSRFFGLPGLTGASYGFVMPDVGLSAAFMVNEFFQNREDIDFFRGRMVRALVSEYVLS